MAVSALLGKELLNGGKHYTARLYGKFSAQVRSIFSLYGRLTQQIPA